MQYRFYIGTGEKAKRLIAACVAAWQMAIVYREALLEEVGADNVFTFPDRPEKPRGFVFAGREEYPGLKFGAVLDGAFSYFPDLATEEGKKLAAALDDPRLEFDDEVFLLRELGMGLEVKGYCENCRNMRAIFRSRAGFLEDCDSIFVKVPASGPVVPAPPDFMREVKASEWLAAQGR